MSRIRKRPLRSEELATFCLNYHMMVKAGINVEDCAALLVESAASPEEAALMQQIYTDLSEGATLSHALAETGRFPVPMVHMLDIAYATGRMESVLLSLSHFYKREAALKSAIKSTIAYPVTMLGAISVILILLIWQVLPVFAGVYQDLGAELPAVAQLFLSLGDVSKWVALVFALVCIALIVLGFCLALHPKGREKLIGIADRLLFHGHFDRSIKRSRFASVMALMVSSGLSMEESLDHAQALLGGSYFTRPLALCRELLAQGVAFPQAAKEAGIFDGVPAGILAAGFRTGSLDSALEELAAQYEEETSAMLSRLLTRSQPIFILILAFSVGLVLLSVMLPLMGMLSAIGV